MGADPEPGAVPPGIESPGGLDPVPPGSPRLAWRKASGRIALAAAGLMAVGVIVIVSVASVPRPHATLQRVGQEADVGMLEILANEGPGEIDPSTLRNYESYRGVEVWSATNAFGALCLLTVDRSGGGDVPGSSCIPAPGKLYVDIMGYGLPDGGRARFVFDGETVDVFEYQPDSAR